MTFYLFFVVFISFHVGSIIPWWNNGLFCSPLYLYIFTCVLTSCNGILTFSILWLTTQNILFRLHNMLFRQFLDCHFDENIQSWYYVLHKISTLLELIYRTINIGNIIQFSLRINYWHFYLVCSMTIRKHSKSLNYGNET